MFIFGGTAGFRRTTVVRIPPKGTEGKISIIFIISTVKAVKRTTEKLFFEVPPHRLCNSGGPPSPSSYRPSGQRKRSATSITSPPRHKESPPSRLFSHVIALIIVNRSPKRMKERIFSVQFLPQQALPRRGNRGYSSSGARLKQASKGTHESSPQLD